MKKSEKRIRNEIAEKILERQGYEFWDEALADAMSQRKDPKSDSLKYLNRIMGSTGSKKYDEEHQPNVTVFAEDGKIIEVAYGDGNAFGGHSLAAELDHKGKVLRVYMEG